MNAPTPRHSSETFQVNCSPVQSFETRAVRVRPGDPIAPRLGRPTRPEPQKPADTPPKS
jgi:hypothetical protein